MQYLAFVYGHCVNKSPPQAFLGEIRPSTDPSITPQKITTPPKGPLSGVWAHGEPQGMWLRFRITPLGVPRPAALAANNAKFCRISMAR